MNWAIFANNDGDVYRISREMSKSEAEAKKQEWIDRAEKEKWGDELLPLEVRKV